MRKKFFTVGPSQIYPCVPRLVDEAVRTHVLSMSHRSAAFEELYHDVARNLGDLLDIPRGHKIYFLSSATECMERAIQNTVDQKCAFVVSGTFGKKFHDIGVELGKACSVYEVGVEEELQEFDFLSPEMIAFTQNDTSTGYRIPMQYIYDVARAYPDALISLDVVSSLPYVEIDYDKVDMVLFSVQKGFGLPAGLAVLIVSPRAYARGVSLYKSDTVTGSYHSFVNLEKYADKKQTFETPNVLGLYLFRGVLKEMMERGIDKIRYETEEKAEMLYEFFDSQGIFEFVVKPSEFQSITTPVVHVEGGSVEILSKLADRGYIVGAGYGANKKTQMRVANFPAQSVSETKNLLSEMKRIL